jgi:hypothetical protein
MHDRQHHIAAGINSKKGFGVRATGKSKSERIENEDHE